ncbi:DUF3219 family protein [Virgibacillus alimentarius]|uniref:DUF3219 domain-containing protein n=1 Tax=Virgibacillus alimentarius TaxID=698769 RepID=A0ABS4SAU4_9BACI|nr:MULTISPECIES: DUF3219 family protein [Virgibacillus]MBP2258467.1 hypothetical protein [Virgibacillus alimentarius]HLR67076.1 DUF3219 family protein [Virgibacillus sp.]
MVNQIILNNYSISVKDYEEKKAKDGDVISVTFDVASEAYHDVTTLLYEGTFDVKVPERDLKFKGTIQEYSTSITNLYEKGNVGEFQLCLKGV